MSQEAPIQSQVEEYPPKTPGSSQDTAAPKKAIKRNYTKKYAEKKPKKADPDTYAYEKDASTLKTIVANIAYWERQHAKAFGSPDSKNYALFKLNGQIALLNEFAKYFNDLGGSYAKFKESNFYKAALDDIKDLNAQAKALYSEKEN